MVGDVTATQGTNSWKRLSGELLAATGRDFERAALIPARAMWPTLIQGRGLGAYDNAGADLIAFNDDGGIEVVIQCKGLFKAEGLQNDQFSQFQKSFESFGKSGLATDTYVVFHNQDGRNRKVAEKIDAGLAKLVSSGKAKKTIHWDRPGFLKALEHRLRDLVSERVGEESLAMLERLDQQFAFGKTYIPRVPVSAKKLALRRGLQPVISDEGPARQVTDIARALSQSTGRWTLLTGLFGTGKTSAALHAAKLHPKQILYVHAGSIEPQHGEGGTNTVMARILDALAVFGDFAADERGLFERLAGPMLRQLLQAPDTDAVLIIDALDENRTLASPNAVTRFASALAELNCPLILTTRQEHFRATFGNFDHLFDELSIKGGNMRDVALLELEPWTAAEVTALVEAAAQEAPNNPGLAELLQAIRAGSDGGWGEAFLRHPLFLRMIVDLAADGGQPSQSRGELISAWVWAKLTRDLKANRSTPAPMQDRNLAIERMEQVMTVVAGLMIEEQEDGWRLLDTIGSGAVIAAAERVFGVANLDLAATISVSLLIPTAVRHRGEVPVRFTHRAFQEYFLARYLMEQGIAADRFPAEVRAFHAGLLANAAAPTG